MSHAKAAKDALDQAVTAFRCSKKLLSKTVAGQQPVSERSLQVQMQSLDNSLAALNSAHTTWISKAELTAEQLAQEDLNEEWLETEWDAVSELQIAYMEKLSICTATTAPPVQTNAQKLQVLQKQMETLQLDIETRIDKLMSRTAEPLTDAQLKVYDEMFLEVKQCLVVQFSELLQSILTLSTDMGKTLEDSEKFRRTQQEHLVTIQFRLADAVLDKSSAAEQPTPHLAIKGVEMEKSKPSIFSGRALDYPHFKQAWKKVAGAIWSDDNQVQQIRLKVDERTCHLISRHETMAEIWKALDAEYVQEQEVINAVNDELIQLCSVKQPTAEYIVELRNG